MRICRQMNRPRLDRYFQLRQSKPNTNPKPQVDLHGTFAQHPIYADQACHLGAFFVEASHFSITLAPLNSIANVASAVGHSFPERATIANTLTDLDLNRDYLHPAAAETLRFFSDHAANEGHGFLLALHPPARIKFRVLQLLMPRNSRVLIDDHLGLGTKRQVGRIRPAPDIDSSQWNNALVVQQSTDPFNFVIDYLHELTHLWNILLLENWVSLNQDRLQKETPPDPLFTQWVKPGEVRQPPTIDSPFWRCVTESCAHAAESSIRQFLFPKENRGEFEAAVVEALFQGLDFMGVGQKSRSQIGLTRANALDFGASVLFKMQDDLT